MTPEELEEKIADLMKLTEELGESYKRAVQMAREIQARIDAVTEWSNGAASK